MKFEEALTRLQLPVVWYSWCASFDKVLYYLEPVPPEVFMVAAVFQTVARASCVEMYLVRGWWAAE